MLSTDPRTLRLSKVRGRPIHILRQPPIPRTHIQTPKPRRCLNTNSNRKPRTPPSLPHRILNRTYYQRTYFYPPPPPTPSSATTLTIWTLIGLNTAIFALWQYASHHQPPAPYPRLRHETHPLTPETLTAHTTLSWPNLHAGRYWTLLTSAFSHQDPLHFIFNMLSLRAFATLLTRVPGVKPSHLILLATGSAIAGSLGFLYHDSHRRQPTSQQKPNLIGRTVEGADRQISRGIPGAAAARGIEIHRSALGASGMVLGFGAAATCLAPFTRMAVMFVPVPVPLWVLTTVYAAADTYFLDDPRSPVAHSAHLGGAVFGGLFYLVVGEVPDK
ncbi:hypothetical protein KC343_g12629 [Hortaea werneckii]|nr:hypothetical protein KC343_g12629 [Hortaea werneckii]